MTGTGWMWEYSESIQQLMFEFGMIAGLISRKDIGLLDDGEYGFLCSWLNGGYPNTPQDIIGWLERLPDEKPV